MSSAHLLLDNFNAGELSPLVGSRFQVEKVANGCRKLRNFIPHPHGPVFRRPGMERMGAAATDATAPNLRSFQFSGSTVFVLELTTVGLRVWQNSALVTLLAPVPLPYSAAELPAVQMAQVNDVVYLTHPNHEPRRLVRWANNDWRLGVVPWKWPALGDENPGSQALPDQYDVASSYDCTPYHVAFSEEFEMWGSSERLILSSGYATAAGTHKVELYREYLYDAGNPTAPFGWLKVLDLEWTSDAPPSLLHLGPFTASPAGTPTDNYRFRYRGEGWQSGSIGRIRFEWSSGSGTVDLDVRPASLPQPPPVFYVPAGKRIIEFSSETALEAPLGLLVKFTEDGEWQGPNPVFDPDAMDVPVETIMPGIQLFPAWYKWTYEGWEKPTATVATFKQINRTAPYQTSIECSDATVGAGRSLIANRELFLPEHVGAFWQLTHRRENAFVELAPTSAAVAATGVLTFTAVAVAGQTVTIGSRTYTWAASVTTTAGTVAIGANQAASQANLVAAINGGAGAGSLYGSQTAPHADVTAAVVGSTVVVTARKPGTGAHSVTLTDTMANASWNDVFLSGGVGANTTISAASTAGLRINGRWEVTTYGSWESTLYLERLTASGGWEFVRSWRSNKDRNVAVQGETDGDETLRLRIVAGTASETSTEATPRFVLEAADARVDGLVKITAVASAVAATCEVISTLLDTSPTYVWTEGAWSTARGFPRVVTMHENRLWFGGTAAEPLRVWASVTGDIENFRRSSLDDASLSFTPTAGELNPIQWLASQGKELVMGTLGDEWTITGEGQPITPTNVKFERQSAHGSAQVQAVMAGEVIAFVQRGGRKVRRISARSDADAWATSDMTVLAEHVTAGGIRQMAYGSHPNAILWAVTGDGKLLGLTLEVEQNVFGWHVHETDGLVESVAVVYGADADEVWVSVLRGTARSIERLDPRVFSRRFEEFDRMIYADAAKVIDLAPASATVGGLAHLNGKTVCVLADGVEHPTRVVSGGAITLQAPASRVVVGLPFTSELQPSKREVQTDKGSAQGRLWRVSRVGVFVHDSRGGQVADSPASRFERLPFPAGSALYSGDLETAIESNARHNIEATVKTSAPLPLNVGAVVLKLDLYGD
jgi:hypothetical protein